MQSVVELRHRLFESIMAGKTTHCDACGQTVKMHNRTVYAAMARALIALYQLPPGEFAYMPELVGRKQGDDAKLRYWGLAEGHPEKRAFWRITDKGRQFVEGKITIPRYARVYDKVCYGFKGAQVSIVDTLENKFDYDELMGR